MPPQIAAAPNAAAIPISRRPAEALALSPSLAVCERASVTAVTAVPVMPLQLPPNGHRTLPPCAVEAKVDRERCHELTCSAGACPPQRRLGGGQARALQPQAGLPNVYQVALTPSSSQSNVTSAVPAAS